MAGDAWQLPASSKPHPDEEVSWCSLPLCSRLLGLLVVVFCKDGSSCKLNLQSSDRTVLDNVYLLGCFETTLSTQVLGV